VTGTVPASVLADLLSHDHGEPERMLNNTLRGLTRLPVRLR
jgi:hypothetical protein